MTRHWTRQSALHKAFELAQRLCPDRSTALAATQRAWATLDVAVAVQDKRLYYRPRRRPGDRQRCRSKVFLSEAHLLQRLVCAEAENAGPADSQAAFTAIFLAAVVRRALERNSFHTALAVTRVVHDYSTREGMRLYACVVRDPQRVRAEDYWRSRKRQMMSELQRRYGDRLELRQGAHGEERFAVVSDVGPLVPLVHETLAALTPWDTPCVVAQELDSCVAGIPQLAWSGGAEEDHREIQRMHALVHPSCFQRLASAAAMDAPTARLAIPRLLCSRGDDDKAERDSGQPLAPHEQEALVAQSEALSRRRRGAPNVCLTVFVDGVERGRIEPDRDATCRLAVGPDAARLEVVTSDAPGGDPLRLAWLPLERDAATDMLRPLRRSLTLEGGQRLTFVVAPGPVNDTDFVPTAEILVRYQETALTRRLALGVRRLRLRAHAWARWPVVRPVVAALAVVGLAVAIFRAVPQPMPTSLPAASPSPSDLAAAPPPPSPPPRARRALPDTHPTADVLTRTLTPRPVGVGLADVRVVWLVTPPAASAESRAVRQIGEHLAASGFVLGTSPKEADAALEITLASTRVDADVHWRARVVNATGAVLWPASGARRGYRGPLSREAARMARELASAVAAAQTDHSDRRPR